MSATARLSRNELAELIGTVEAEGGDAKELKNLLAQIDEDIRLKQPPVRRNTPSTILREDEPTTEERLNEEAGDLFPDGISVEILDMCIEYDGKYSLKELKAMCKEAGISPNGHKKLLAAKLIAHQGGRNMAEKIDVRFQNQWQAKADEELKIPEAYVKELKFEIVVFGKREFTFRCKKYSQVEGGAWSFDGVIIDTSKRNSVGEVQLKRLTYHPVISLVNVGFMVLPAPEGVEVSEITEGGGD